METKGVLGIEKLGLFALNRPYVSLILVSLLTLLLLPGALFIEFNSKTRDIFRSQSAEFQHYQEMVAQYPSSETDFYFIVEGQRMFTPKALEQLGALHMDLFSIDGIQGVHSMFSARYPPSDDKGQSYRPVYPWHLDEIRDAEAVKREFLKHPHVAGKLLSADGRLSLFIITLNSSGIGLEQVKRISHEIDEISAELLADTGLEYTMTGGQVLRVEIISALMRDNLTFIVTGVLLGLSLTWVFLKRLKYVAIAAAPILFTLVWLVGGMGYLGLEFNLLTNAVPTLVIAISLSEALHILILLSRYRELGMESSDALARTIGEIGLPCFLSYFTTAIALLSLTFVPYPFVSNFGYTAVMGVVMAYVATMLLMPALSVLTLSRDNSKISSTQDHGISSPITIITHFAANSVSARPGWIVTIGVALILTFGALYSQAKPSYIYTENLPEESTALDALVKINQHLSGASTLRIFVRWPEEEGESSQRIVKLVGEVHREMEQVPWVKSVWSLHSVDQWVNRGRSGGVDIIDYLHNFEPNIKDKLVSSDRRTAMVSAYFTGVDAVELLPKLKRLESRFHELEQRFPGLKVSLTGLSPLSVKASYEMIEQLNIGLLLAVSLIIVLIALLLRSIQSALLSILPNLLPIVVGGGYLYLAGYGLQFYSVIAFTIGFGIAVDSTIHILNRYRISQEAGLKPQQAVRQTIMTMGPVLIVSTLVLASGFGATLLSAMPMVELFGQVSLIMLFTAMIGDLVLLPAIIRVVDGWMGG